MKQSRYVLNHVIVKEILGKDILDALELSVKSLPGTSSKFLQVSGIKFKYDDSFKSTVMVDEYENFIKVGGERRVYDVYINDKKVDENKKYTISLDDFLAEGGDGYSMFTKYNLTNDTLMIDNEALKFYLINELNRTIPEEYKYIQGRIVKEKKSNSSYFDIKHNYMKPSQRTIKNMLRKEEKADLINQSLLDFEESNG